MSQERIVSQPPIEKGVSTSTVIILFGRPGSGKETAGAILKEKYGYFFRNGKEDYTPEMLENIKLDIPLTLEQRDEHAKRMIASVKRLRQEHPRFALKHVLPMEKERLMLQEALPDATFLYVTAPLDLIRERVVDRNLNKGHYITLEYAEQIFEIFEEPTHPHVKIVNDASGIEKITTQLEEILAKSSLTDVVK